MKFERDEMLDSVQLDFPHTPLWNEVVRQSYEWNEVVPYGIKLSFRGGQEATDS